MAWNLAPMKDFVDKNKETNEAAQATLGDLYVTPAIEND